MTRAVRTPSGCSSTINFAEGMWGVHRDQKPWKMMQYERVTGILRLAIELQGRRGGLTIAVPG